MSISQCHEERWSVCVDAFRLGLCFIYIITENSRSKIALLDCASRELTASGGPMVTGQSVMAAQSPRFEWKPAASHSERCQMIVSEDLTCLFIVACCRPEAERWLSMLSLEATAAKENGRKAGPVRRLKGAPWRMDAMTGLVVDQVRIRSL